MSSWPTAENVGCYYIDPDHAASTDTSNTYGYPNKPRKTWAETTYSAGSYISIQSGTHNGGGQIISTFNGDANNIVWIVGGGTASITGGFIVKGAYVIIDNLDFAYPGMVLFRPHTSSTLDHAVVRNSRFVGDGADHGAANVISIYGGTDTSHHDFVIYNNTISEYGDNEAVSENDFHGIKPTSYAYNVWILNNTVYNLGGDSVQVGDATIDDAVRPEYVYIGGNTFYGNHENGVDIKEANYVFISENIFYNTVAPLTIIHNAAADIWIINNIFRDSSNGVFSTSASNLYVIGNVFYNLNHTGIFNATDSYSYDGRAIGAYSTTNVSIINNTIYDADVGVQLRAVNASANKVINNIISAKAESTGYEIYVASEEDDVDLDYNVLYDSSGSVDIGWGGSTQRTLAYIQALSECVNCIESNPLLNNPIVDFSLNFTSPAKNSGTVSDIYATYLSTYSLSIAIDITDKTRPVDSWDIGAYEYESVSGVITIGTGGSFTLR